VAFAEASPDPTPDELFAHVYASPVRNAPRQLPGDPVITVGGADAFGPLAVPLLAPAAARLWMGMARVTGRPHSKASPRTVYRSVCGTRGSAHRVPALRPCGVWLQAR
jgi:hypothetical protein